MTDTENTESRVPVPEAERLPIPIERGIQGRKKETLDIPGMDGKWVEVRRSIPARIVRNAEEDQSVEGMRQAGRIFDTVGAEALAEFQKFAQQEVKKAAAKKQGELPGLDEVDMDSLVTYMVTAWNLEDEDGQPLPTSKENIQDLDPVTTEWLHELVRARVPQQDHRGNS